MSKKLMAAVACVLAFAAVGCDSSNMTAWGLTAPDSDANLRLGATVGEEKNAEVFAEIGYNSSGFNDGTPDRFGLGFIYHLTQELHWEDTPASSPIANVLETLQARPYVGIGCMVDRGTQMLEGKWIVGTTFADNPDRPWSFIAELQEGDGLVTARDDSAVFFGVRLEF